MKKVMIIEDDVFFVSRFKSMFKFYEIYSYFSSKMFFSELEYNKQILLEKISNIDIFILDIDISRDKDIFGSGILELISCYKKSGSKVISISDDSKDKTHEAMCKIKTYHKINFDVCIKKSLENVYQAINLHSRIALN